MKIDNIELYNYLKSKGVDKLYHANTVATSITYIEQGGLLSRGEVMSNGLFQTEQSSDQKDKLVNVWNDIFLDTSDLHGGMFPRQNLYGPITFCYNTTFLLNENIDVWITKDNPIRWQVGQIDEEKYFSTIDEFDIMWTAPNRQQRMITLRNKSGILPFVYLDSIFIDDPQIVRNNKVLFNSVISNLNRSRRGNLDLHGKFKRRKCQQCYCGDNYNSMNLPELKRLFSVKH